MFTLNRLHLTESARTGLDGAADVYLAIDELIGDAHQAHWVDGFEPCFETRGTIELFAYLYVAAADIWRGMDNMTRENAIIIAERAFSKIYHFYTD